MAGSRKQKSGQISGLSGLRTLAVFGVLLFHAFPQTVKGGYFGVILFFAISGFLTAYNDVRKGGEAILTYYKKRFLRIYPALIIMLFISVEVIALLDKFKLMNVQEELCSVLFAYNNYWQISKRADYFANLSANSAFTHLWYTSILIQFELLWPFLFRLFRRFKQNLKPFGLLVFVSMLVMPVGSLIGGISQSQLYYGTFARIHALLIGTWFGWQRALLEKKRIKRIRALPAILLLSLYCFGSICIFLTAGGDHPSVYRYGIVLYALVSGIIIFLLSCSEERIGMILDNPACRFFSTYSYEIYLWQYPVLFVFAILDRSSQYVLQMGILLVLSIWSHELIAFLQRLAARLKRE